MNPKCFVKGRNIIFSTLDYGDVSTACLGALAHVPSAEICDSLRHCHSSWSFFLLHRSQKKSIWAGTSATAVQSPGSLCKLPCWVTNWSVLLTWDEVRHPQEEGRAKFVKFLWVTTTPISYIPSLWSFDELLQFFKNYLHYIWTVFLHVNLSYLEES